MAHWWHPEPYAEDYQQAAYNGFPFLPEFGHRRTAPREEPFVHWRPSGAGGRGWYQGGRKLHGFKSKKYWARPVDGARRGTLGRIKDGLTGEGPDIFVVANGDRRTLHRDMPSRNHWSHWDSTGLRWLDDGRDANWRSPVEDMDWYPPGNLGSTPWARRDRDEVYNFRTRRYDDLRPGNQWKFWSDAHWPKGQRKRYGVPTAWREWDGHWNTTVDGSAGRWPGGRPLRC
ncbi:hypothetical protein M409DRAFT_21851 [Zasmidium cellare ATCC 36951]|uniref:Uncharacterized protein n=1 Tax=Zasmidium cellare ATCC 36951 TaxID=1080233 RepID=A0A6A6CN97_ZASCE|nr:uncharacterized protein M409DRAFT_21851 [Zasmidium cellare ATCC 36951]KAF2167698.1 hypothetical protein M409DRAFT_21851 [Zasmidium cellare ATCC 36951]